MKKTLLSTAIAAALATSAFSAMAEDAPAASPLTFNVGVVSDYLFRGISQTHGDPALQGGVDYAFSNGFYVGAWASTISWVKDYTGKGTTEVDVYGGYKGSVTPDVGFDVGAIAYTYPGRGAGTTFGDTPTTAEIYGALSYQDFSVKYSYVVSDYFISWRSASGGKTNGSGYLELNYAHDFGNTWAVSAHVGHQKVDGLSLADYTDWKIGVTKDVGFGVVGLSYSATNTSGSCDSSVGGTNAYCWPNNNFVAGTGSTTGWKDMSKDKLLLTFLKTF